MKRSPSIGYHPFSLGLGIYSSVLNFCYFTNVNFFTGFFEIYVYIVVWKFFDYKILTIVQSFQEFGRFLCSSCLGYMISEDILYFHYHAFTSFSLGFQYPTKIGISHLCERKIPRNFMALLTHHLGGSGEPMLSNEFFN